jgi:hypothetical protein
MALLGATFISQIGAAGEFASFETRLLARQNQERETVGAPPLVWNARLATRAQAWADHLAQTSRFEHSPNLPGEPFEGENIWGGTPGAFGPEAMVDLWIKEKTHFVPGTFPSNSNTGDVEDVSHYTQLIWSRTRQVGCGRSRGPREEILVCRYSEPGNVIGGSV